MGEAIVYNCSDRLISTLTVLGCSIVGFGWACRRLAGAPPSSSSKLKST